MKEEPTETSGLPVVLRAWSIGAEAHRRLTCGSRFARIHSAYSGALNILTKEGLVSIVPRPAGRGPLNLTLNDSSPLCSGDPEDREVLLSRNGLSIGRRLSIDYGSPELYDPQPRFDSLPGSTAEIEANLATLCSRIMTSGAEGGMTPLLQIIGQSSPATLTERPTPYVLSALPGARRFVAALESEDYVNIRRSVRELAGLGIGLTPSSDDVIMGALVAVLLGASNGVGGSPALEDVARCIAEVSSGRTSTLSHEFIFQAAHGRAHEKVRGLAEAVYAGDQLKVELAALEVLRLGHTSGTDLAVGVALGTSAALARGTPGRGA